MSFRQKAALALDEQRQLNALIAAHGWEPTARMLGLNESVINQLAYGVRAILPTVARATEVLRARARKSA